MNNSYIYFALLLIFIVIFISIVYVTQIKTTESFTVDINEDNYPFDMKESMGPYSNLLLKPEGDSSWRHDPSNLPLYKPDTLFTPQGTPLPLKDESKITSLPFDSNGSSVDGLAKSPKNMFMFAYNQCRPECCPSTFSCDRGCICTTAQQRHFINSRGTPQLTKRGNPDI